MKPASTLPERESERKAFAQPRFIYSYPCIDLNSIFTTHRPNGLDAKISIWRNHCIHSSGTRTTTARFEIRECRTHFVTSYRRNLYSFACIKYLFIYEYVSDMSHNINNINFINCSTRHVPCSVHVKNIFHSVVIFHYVCVRSIVSPFYSLITIIILSFSLTTIA